MVNLLQETEEAIRDAGFTVEDITYIGSSYIPRSCTWEDFSKMADVDYDNGFGLAEVRCDLIIAFSDGSVLRRSEYDGSEWWDYTPIFTPPTDPKVMVNLFEDWDKDLSSEEY